nr:DUF2523 domain-containing protein [uncultured Rhodoferax sp.]
MKLGTWLLSLMSPALGRILTALGFSVVSITGMDAIFSQLKSQLVSGLYSLPADVLNVFLLVGGGQALGIIVGAGVTRLALWKISSATRILGVNPS